jgi:hypothetical protein
MITDLGTPKIVDRRTFHLEVDALCMQDNAHMGGSGAIAAVRR